MNFDNVMFPFVMIEIALESIPSGTLITMIWSGVMKSLDVRVEATFLGKTRIAYTTFIWLFSGMNSFVIG